ncbi:MAG: VOC family protein [Streptosporangiaceae bacterium]
MASMIGRLHHLILDCPDPLALATFYSELLGQPITYRSDDFVVVGEEGRGLGGYRLARSGKLSPQQAT